MMAVRAVLVDKNGVVIPDGYFMASPENDAVNSGKPDHNGNICVSHPQALPGDTITKGAWVQSPSNAAATQQSVSS